MIKMSFSYRGETRELDDLARQEAGGSFVRLSKGFTHYELSNPEAEATVVLVHGFSTPYFIYDPTFEFLTQSNFRVLRYDLFGRGFSDRPDAPYDIELFVEQLQELTEALYLAGPINLVGLSMGGPISATFAARFPERVHRLVLIDPAGAKTSFPFLTTKIANIPRLGETIFNLIGTGGLAKNFASNFFDRPSVELFQDRDQIQMQFKGYRQAILSTIRSGMLGSFVETYEQVGKMNKPVLLFWGRHDHTVPLEHSQLLCQAIPQVEFHVIEGCGHIPHHEKPEEVNPILLRFLSS